MSLGASELLVVLAVLLLLFGASQLPKLARSLGEAAKELRAGLSDQPTRSARGSGQPPE